MFRVTLENKTTLQQAFCIVAKSTYYKATLE